MKKSYFSKLLIIGVFFAFTVNLQAQKQIERKKSVANTNKKNQHTSKMQSMNAENKIENLKICNTKIFQ